MNSKTFSPGRLTTTTWGRRSLLGLAVATAALLTTGPAWAADVTVTANVPQQLTNFNTTITLPQFDPTQHPAGIVLSQVTCRVDANVAGTIEAENLGPNASAITSRLSADVTLGDASSILATAAAASQQFTDAVASHDATSDYTGLDSAKHASVTGSGTASATITDPVKLALFTGSGNITLPVSATGTSFASGPGNVQSRFTTLAGADISCVYTFRGVSSTAVKLRSFTATPSSNSVALGWRTASEVDVLGYNVYGLVHGKRVKLNAKLMASKGNGGHAYSFTYRLPHGKQAPSRFWLQTVNLNGSRQWSLAH